MADKLLRANGNLIYADNSGSNTTRGMVPVGTIIAVSQGYHADATNGAFVGAADSIGDGWQACDGSAINDAESPIWNAASRFVPDLTDSRFLQGAVTAGSTGGSNGGNATSGGSATFNRNTMNSSQSSHSHTSNNMIARITVNSGWNIHYQQRSGASQWDATRMLNFSSSESGTAGDNLTEGADVEGTTSSTTVSWSSSTVTTSFTQPTVTNNRPLFVSTAYYIRIK